VSGGSAPVAIDHEAARARFIEAMDDDLNTPRALAALFDLARDINREAAAGGDVAPAQATLRELCGVLGLTLEAPPARSLAAAPFIELLIEIRAELRAARQWALADRIRDRLAALGIELQDSPDGTTWSER
jgi:cysteinyl-tRNA synthetase